MKTLLNMQDDWDTRSIDDKVAIACAMAGVSVTAHWAAMRDTLVFFGDQAGVDLRGVSDETVRVFAARLAQRAARKALAGCEAGHFTLDEFVWAEETDDIMNEAAWETVHELFVYEVTQ